MNRTDDHPATRALPGTERAAVPDGSRRAAIERRSFMAGVGAGVLVPAAASAAGSAAPFASSHGPAQSSPEASFERFFDNRLPEQLEAHDLAGATVAVVADGEIAFTKGYGYADVAAETPVEAESTIFRVASTSKPVTGTAVMRAVEAGHVELEADINRYLEEITIPDTHPEAITLEHLGTHTAGFESQYIGQYARDRTDPRSLGAVLADPPPRVHAPGQVAHYSNYGIALAGHAVAAAAGRTFREYVQEAVFEPLGMDRSTFRATPPGELAADVTKAYDFDADAAEFQEITVPYELRRPAGAMATTAEDMARFMLLHLQNGRVDGRAVLRPETVAGMHERRFSNHPAVDGLGYMFLEEQRGDTRLVKHGGQLRGTTSRMALLPKADLGVFVAYNTTGASDAADAVVAAFLEAYAPPGEPPSIEPDGRPARADAIEGWYRFTRVPESPMKPIFGIGGTVEVRVEPDGTLVTAPTAPGVDPIRWVEVSPLVFRAVGDSPQVSRYNHLAFRADDGEITYVFFRNPTGSYRRLDRIEQPWLHLGVVAAFLLAMLSAVLGWSGAALRRWVRGMPSPPGRPRAARWLAAGTAAGLVGGPIGLVAALAGGAVNLTYGLPTWFVAVLALPVLGALGALATLGVTALAWRDGYWGLASRVHHTIVAAVCVAFAWLLAYWGLLWTPL